MSPNPTAAPEAETDADHAPFPPPLMERVGFLLAQVKGGAEEICGRALEPVGLHVRQFGLLTVLATEGPRSQQSLAEWIRMDRTSMVALVDSLEEHGYVRRKRNPDDRRAYLLQLTSEGRSVQRRGKKLMLKAEDELLGALSEREREQFRKSLAKIAADIGRAPALDRSSLP
jgi:DNA-binding MarR family transcriptional regulator